MLRLYWLIDYNNASNLAKDLLLAEGMADPTYDEAIRRIRRMHWLHYPIQAAVMAAFVLAASRRTAGSGTVNPQLATWPALLLLGAYCCWWVCSCTWFLPRLSRTYAGQRRRTCGCTKAAFFYATAY